METIGIELRHTVLIVDNILSVSSILCSILMILGYCFIRATDKSVDRLSLRLLVETCIFNIIFGVSQLLLNSEYSIGSDPRCNAVMTVFVFSDLASSLLLTCIAINLLLIICYEPQLKVSRRALEILYTLGSILFSGFIAANPFFSPNKVYDYSDSLHQCWFAYSTPPKDEQIFWQLWTFHFWQMTGVITSIVCFSIVLIKLRREEIHIDDNLESAQNSVTKWMVSENAEEVENDESTEQAEEHKNTFNEAIRRQGTDLSERITILKFFLPRRWFRKTERHRAAHAAITQNRRVSFVSRTIRQVICYLAVLIITEIFNFGSLIDLIVSSRYQPIYYFLGYLSTGARGPLLLLCFLIDPSLWSAWEVYSNRKKAERMLKSMETASASEVINSTATFTPVQTSDLDSILNSC
ncbi:hypothetical protein K450DRAFT_220222 [Umbelopsis ramanniana AG]|uniref:Uncharacterized protein n=1 Tax=Umbelopsis ramanniana AG TaxID=1314678 RepID=A0AAD5EHW2_UMBRA|nr:uncharacterized protein K450DRAFT_220222 [Umbelopsis ramanniana AG]KAI8583839.1 hypothetical protein K450DRAFT_220222 [Umbelopsis ramanniana AG]